MLRPECFSSDAQFEQYMEQLEKAKKDPKQGVPSDATYCWDCTREYQKEMTEENQCKYPEVKFLEFPPDFSQRGVQGVRLSQLISRRITIPSTPSASSAPASTSATPDSKPSAAP